MATDTPSSTLDALHAAIEAAIRARFPDLPTVEFYREANNDALPTPACLLAMTRCDRGDADAEFVRIWREANAGRPRHP